jgi:hypothetical protein
MFDSPFHWLSASTFPVMVMVANIKCGLSSHGNGCGIDYDTILLKLEGIFLLLIREVLPQKQK